MKKGLIFFLIAAVLLGLSATLLFVVPAKNADANDVSLERQYEDATESDVQADAMYEQQQTDVQTGTVSLQPDSMADATAATSGSDGTAVTADLKGSAVPPLSMEEVVQTLDLPKTLEEIEPDSWFANFLEQLAQAKNAGQSWVDQFSIVRDTTTGKLLVRFRQASLKSESEARVRSSITEDRRPKDVISNAPEFALPREIGDNYNYAKLYIQCVILSNPLEALQVAEYLRDVKFNAKDSTLGSHLYWLEEYLTYMDKAYENVDRKNLTGKIHQEWLDAGKAPRGLEVTLDPTCEFVSTEANAQTGRVDQMTVSIGLCEVLDAFDREFVTNVTADWFYELLPLESASLLRATRCNTSETGDWVRFQFQDPKSDRVLFVILFNVGDLRVGHPAVVQTPTATPKPTTTPAPAKTPTPNTTPNPNPNPSNNPDPTPGPSNNPDPAPNPDNNPDPTPGPENNPDPAPNPDNNPDPTPGPSDNPDPGPTPDSNPGKDESLKPDEQGNAPEGGGHNDDQGPGPFEPEPTVQKPDTDKPEEAQYQPQADPDRTHDSHDDSPENTQGHVGPSDDEIQAPGTSSTTTETTHNDDGSTTTTTTTTTGHTEENGGHTQDVVTETVTTNPDGTETTTLEQIDNENIADRPVEAEFNQEAGGADQNTGDDSDDAPDFLPD